jgi:hypothetical protein
MLKIKDSVYFLHLFSASIIFFCLLLNLNTVVASAQDSEGTNNNTTENKKTDKKVVIPDLNQLSVPDSPALDLIGSNISIKPSETPRAFGLNLLESISNSEGNFPQNLAIEFAPYWWSSHPGLTYDDYYKKTGFGEAIIETLSFSIGGRDAKIQQGEEVDGTTLGLGLRFNLLAGQKNPALTDLEPNLERELKDFRRQFLQECVSFRDANLSTEEVQKQINGCVDKKTNKKWSELLKEKATQFGELQKLRTGWQLEFATAGAFDFPGNDFDEAEFSRFGTWLTTSYRGTKVIKDENGKKSSIASPIQFLGVAKYSLEELNDNSNNFFDLGAGIVYQLNQTPLALSLEYVRRFGDEGDDRVVGVAEYRINNNYTVFATYGKTFENSFEGDEDLVTLFGLKIGAGKNQVTQELLPSLTP